MRPEDYDLRGGTVVQWEEDLHDDAVWREDLIQIGFDGRVVDVGWYGEGNGFVVVVVVGEDWDHPVWRDSCVSVRDVPKLLRAALAFTGEPKA